MESFKLVESRFICFAPESVSATGLYVGSGIVSVFTESVASSPDLPPVPQDIIITAQANEKYSFLIVFSINYAFVKGICDDLVNG